MKKIFLFLLFVNLYSANLVKVETLIKANDTQSFNFNANAIFSIKSDIASQTSGLVKKINFKVGDFVKKDSVLLTLDTQILQEKLNSSKALLSQEEIKLKKANQDFQRAKNLKKTNSISQQEYDNLLTNLNSIQKQLKSMQSLIKLEHLELEYKKIKAPYDGLITNKNTQIAQWINTGGTIAQMINLDKKEVNVYLPIDFAKNIKLNDKVKVKINNKIYHESIFAIIPLVDMKTKNFLAKITLNNKINIFDNMQVEVIFDIKKYNFFKIKRDALIKNYDTYHVFLLKDDKARKIEVNVESFWGEFAYITSDQLSENEKIIVVGNENLKNNQKIKVIQ